MNRDSWLVHQKWPRWPNGNGAYFPRRKFGVSLGTQASVGVAGVGVDGVGLVLTAR